MSIVMLGGCFSPVPAEETRAVAFMVVGEGTASEMTEVAQAVRAIFDYFPTISTFCIEMDDGMRCLDKEDIIRADQ